MQATQKYIGLDVHKDTICAARADGGTFEAAIDLGRIAHDVGRLKKLLARQGPFDCLHVAYEAGPTGFGLCRELRAEGIDCIVVAPSKTPMPPGGRIKTDRRDAELLARNLRVNALVAIDVPDVRVEALRDYVRMREDMVWARQKARQQLKGFLLRHGRPWKGKSSWTQPHITWMRSQRFDIEELRVAMDHMLAETIRLDGKVREFDKELVALIEALPQATAFHYFQALRGAAEIVSATLVAEVGDFRRFKTAGQFMSYIGLTPSEHSSGNDIRRGRITKAGNPHVRRVLVEAAWSARYRPARSHHMQLRLARVPVEIQDIAWKAQVRLHQRFRSMLARGKSVQHTIVAVARELAGFVWAIGQLVPSTNKSA
jgi:transposase